MLNLTLYKLVQIFQNLEFFTKAAEGEIRRVAKKGCRPLQSTACFPLHG